MDAVQLIILRQVSGLMPEVANGLELDRQLIEFDDDKHQYVVNDHPWDFATGNNLVDCTTGFIVVDETYQKVYGPVRDLAKAEAAVDKARARISVMFEGLDDDEDEMTAPEEPAEVASPSFV